MGEIIIKPSRDRDEYVIWSTFVDRPVAYGSRAETLEHLGGDIKAGTCPTCRQYVSQDSTPEVRLARTDRNGSSDMSHRFGWWDDDEFIYAQAGMLRREDLVRACELLCEDRDDEVLPMLRPFEDD